MNTKNINLEKFRNELKENAAKANWKDRQKIIDLALKYEP